MGISENNADRKACALDLSMFCSRKRPQIGSCFNVRSFGRRRMNVFIVGAAGAIGAALLELYLQNPMIERIVATHHLPMRSTHDKLQWLTCDLRDEQAIAACAEHIAAM